MELRRLWLCVFGLNEEAFMASQARIPVAGCHVQARISFQLAPKGTFFFFLLLNLWVMTWYCKKFASPFGVEGGQVFGPRLFLFWVLNGLNWD